MDLALHANPTLRDAAARLRALAGEAFDQDFIGIPSELRALRRAGGTQLFTFADAGAGAPCAASRAYARSPRYAEGLAAVRAAFDAEPGCSALLVRRGAGVALVDGRPRAVDARSDSDPIDPADPDAPLRLEMVRLAAGLPDGGTTALDARAGDLLSPQARLRARLLTVVRGLELTRAGAGALLCRVDPDGGRAPLLFCSLPARPRVRLAS